MKEFINELIYHVRAWFILSLEAIKLKLAIWLSDMKQKANNRRYFVVLLTVGHNKNGTPKTRLRSINNHEFKHLKRIKWLPKRMTTLELEQKCFYATPLSNNNKWTKEQRAEAKARYLNYYKVMHQLKI